MPPPLAPTMPATCVPWPAQSSGLASGAGPAASAGAARVVGVADEVVAGDDARGRKRRRAGRAGAAEGRMVDVDAGVDDADLDARRRSGRAGSARCRRRSWSIAATRSGALPAGRLRRRRAMIVSTGYIAFTPGRRASFAGSPASTSIEKPLNSVSNERRSLKRTPAAAASRRNARLLGAHARQRGAVGRGRAGELDEPVPASLRRRLRNRLRLSLQGEQRHRRRDGRQDRPAKHVPHRLLLR